jgi:hypothetical protein
VSAAHRYRTLWLIVGGLLLPFVLAAALYWSGWRPTIQVRGQLLPAGPALLGESALEGRWGLALVTASPCDSRCVESLDELRRVHVALYKSMPAVKRLWLASADQLAARAEALHARWPDLALIVADPVIQDALLADAAAVPTGAASLASAAEAVVIVFDPAGRPVLRYPQPIDAKAVLTDLRRLLSPTR